MRRECGTVSYYILMWAVIADVSYAMEGVTSRGSVPTSPHLPITLDITGQATRNAMWRGALKSRDHSADMCWRSAATANEICLRSATDARRRLKLARQRSRVGELAYQGGNPPTQLVTWHRGRTIWCLDIALLGQQRRGRK
jgi:hypothetical protein